MRVRFVWFGLVWFGLVWESGRFFVWLVDWLLTRLLACLLTYLLTYRLGDYLRTSIIHSAYRNGCPTSDAKNLDLVEKLAAIAEKKGCTKGQLTLAWLMAQGGDVIPIPGTKKVKYLEENLGSLRVELSEGEVGEIRGAVEVCVTAGDRYPGVMAKVCFGDTPELNREGRK